MLSLRDILFTVSGFGALPLLPIGGLQNHTWLLASCWPALCWILPSSCMLACVHTLLGLLGPIFFFLLSHSTECIFPSWLCHLLVNLGCPAWLCFSREHFFFIVSSPELTICKQTFKSSSYLTSFSEHSKKRSNVRLHILTKLGVYFSFADFKVREFMWRSILLSTQARGQVEGCYFC